MTEKMTEGEARAQFWAAGLELVDHIQDTHGIDFATNFHRFITGLASPRLRRVQVAGTSYPGPGLVQHRIVMEDMEAAAGPDQLRHIQAANRWRVVAQTLMRQTGTPVDVLIAPEIMGAANPSRRRLLAAHYLGMAIDPARPGRVRPAPGGTRLITGTALVAEGGTSLYREALSHDGGALPIATSNAFYEPGHPQVTAWQQQEARFRDISPEIAADHFMRVIAAE